MRDRSGQSRNAHASSRPSTMRRSPLAGILPNDFALEDQEDAAEQTGNDHRDGKWSGTRVAPTSSIAGVLAASTAELRPREGGDPWQPRLDAHTIRGPNIMKAPSPARLRTKQ